MRFRRPVLTARSAVGAVCLWALWSFLGAQPQAQVGARGARPGPRQQQAEQRPPQRDPSIAGPRLVIETDKGTIVVETFPEDAPKTVAHVVALVEQGFYDGQRFHRAEPQFIVQFGDPQSRDLEKRARWGRGPGDGSGKPIGAAEFSKRRRHVAGAVGMAHAGDPFKADSQIYITRAPLPQFDGLFVVFGQVVSGEDVLARIERGDIVRRVTVGAPGDGQ